MRTYDADDLLGEQFKGLPIGDVLTARDIPAQGWNVLRGDTATPVAVLRASALDQNIETMRLYCEQSGVSLAPHAKTSLSPQLIARQRDAGAWAFTAALPFHVRLLWSFGVQRVLLANELVDPAALRWVATELAQHPERELICYVDSVAGVEMAQAAMADAGGGRRLPVLIELGHEHGRTGIREPEDAIVLARAVATAPQLMLVGVAAYEGTIASVRTTETVTVVQDFLEGVRRTTARMHDLGLFAETGELMVTAGGSVFFDLVTSVLAPLAADGFRVVLRSGCYLTHDQGLYAAGSPATTTAWQLPAFQPALEVWTRVVSRPEPGLALLNAGRRDISHDAGLPVPFAAHHSSGGPVDLTGAQITALSDQHAFLRIDADSALAVGDLVGLGVSHPCTTLDRWRLLLVVDDHYTVISSARTYF